MQDEMIDLSSGSAEISPLILSATWQTLLRNVATICPAITRYVSNVGLMLGQRRRRCPNIKPTLDLGI